MALNDIIYQMQQERIQTEENRKHDEVTNRSLLVQYIGRSIQNEVELIYTSICTQIAKSITNEKQHTVSFHIQVPKRIILQDANNHYVDYWGKYANTQKELNLIEVKPIDEYSHSLLAIPIICERDTKFSTTSYYTRFYSCLQEKCRADGIYLSELMALKQVYKRVERTTHTISDSYVPLNSRPLSLRGLLNSLIETVYTPVIIVKYQK